MTVKAPRLSYGFEDQQIREGIEKLVGRESADTHRYAYVEGWLDRAVPFVFEVYRQAIAADAGVIVYLDDTELKVEIDPWLRSGRVHWGRLTHD